MVKLKTLKEHICCFNDVRSEIDIRCTTCGKKNIKLSAKEFMEQVGFITLEECNQKVAEAKREERKLILDIVKGLQETDYKEYEMFGLSVSSYNVLRRELGDKVE